jgi:hypothetical protein
MVMGSCEGCNEPLVSMKDFDVGEKICVCNLTISTLYCT